MPTSNSLPITRHPVIALLLALACGSDNVSPEPAVPGERSSSPMSAPARANAQPSTTSETEEPSLAPTPTNTSPDASSTALAPALPVVEQTDHAALLAASSAQLADNKRLVYDMWRTLIEARDTQAGARYFAEDYIQHNPNADTGRAGVLAFFQSLGAPQPVADRVQAKLVAIVAEGDYVAMVRVDERSTPRPYTTTWFDLFRLEGGLIAEHWDHGTLPMGATPRQYVPPVATVDQEPALISTDPSLEANKRLVHEMWRTLLDAQQVEQAPRFLAEGYAQHNPLANTGLAGFLGFFRPIAMPREVAPNIAGFIHMMAEDDLVVLATVRSYSDATAEPYTTTWFDMFRVAQTQLVEHWDTATLLE